MAAINGVAQCGGAQRKLQSAGYTVAFNDSMAKWHQWRRSWLMCRRGGARLASALNRRIPNGWRGGSGVSAAAAMVAHRRRINVAGSQYLNGVAGAQ